MKKKHKKWLWLAAAATGVVLYSRKKKTEQKVVAKALQENAQVATEQAHSGYFSVG